MQTKPFPSPNRETCSNVRLAEIQVMEINKICFQRGSLLLATRLLAHFRVDILSCDQLVRQVFFWSVHLGDLPFPQHSIVLLNNFRPRENCRSSNGRPYWLKCRRKGPPKITFKMGTIL